MIDGVIGVYKAYVTRVGGGPFLTEDLGDAGARLQEAGHEFGATTGRPRRTGWFDGPMARYARMINGLGEVALTKLDVLTGFESIPVCTGYKIGDMVTSSFSAVMNSLDIVEPVYVVLSGWKEEISNVRKFNDLPVNAQNYVKFLEGLIGAQISMISVGPDRDQVIEV
jgi:adenylosuccinate synthase